MTKYKVVFWLVISLVIFFTRFYKLQSIPPSLTIDEVSIGYNAYSILKTGRDEWGTFLPLSFKSVGDYKSPTLIYLTVPFVKIFGLNELSTRLPVAIFSAINVFLFWILVKKHIFNTKYLLLPYLATFIFSLSPWLIPFSRSGFEAIVAFTFLLANIIFAFEFRKTGKTSHFFLLFFFAFLASITYHSTKVVVPLLNLFFVLSELRFLKTQVLNWFSKNKLSFWLVLLLLVSLAVFFIRNFIFGSGATRASMTFLSKDFDFNQALMPTFNAYPLSWLTSVNGLIAFWFKRFLEYFSPNFYLSSGLGLVTPGQPGQGVIYAIEYPFLVVGFLLMLFKSGFFRSIISSNLARTLLVSWFFLALIPASITNNGQHPLRTLNLVPVISILIALGLTYILTLIKSRGWQILLTLVVIFGYSVGIVRFIDYYALHYSVELSEARSYGWRETALYAKDNHSKYDKVFVDPQFGTQGPYTYGVPHLYFLFYSTYEPNSYQNNPLRSTGSSNFENYYFGPINWPDIDHTKNNLYIGSPWSFPSELLESPHRRLYVSFLNQSSGLYAISDQ